MIVEFDQLPDNSRLWIYQSSRTLTGQEESEIIKQGNLFIDSWTAHQAGLKGSIRVLFHMFILIGVDQSYNEASGCSIDKKVHFIQQAGAHTGIDFFNRMNLAFLAENGNVELMPASLIESGFSSGKLSPDTVVFNNLISTIGELNTNWQIPLKNSWAMNFMGNKVE